MPPANELWDLDWIDLKELRDAGARRGDDAVDRVLKAGKLVGDRVYIHPDTRRRLQRELGGKQDAGVSLGGCC